MYLEDAGFPAFMQWLVEVSQASGLARRSVSTLIRRGARKIDRSAQYAPLGRALPAPREGVLSRSSLPLLAMGRDVPDGACT